MSFFIQQEIERLRIEVLNCLNSGSTYRLDRLWAAKQALEWSLDPNGSKSAHEMIMETGPKLGCSEPTLESAGSTALQGQTIGSKTTDHRMSQSTEPDTQTVAGSTAHEPQRPAAEGGKCQFLELGAGSEPMRVVVIDDAQGFGIRFLKGQ